MKDFLKSFSSLIFILLLLLSLTVIIIKSLLIICQPTNQKWNPVHLLWVSCLGAASKNFRFLLPDDTYIF